MLLILFISLLILLCILLYLNNGDPLAPSSLSCAMFTLSTLVALLNLKKWGISYSGETVVLILTALIAFGIGALLVKLLPNIMIINYKKKEDKDSNNKNPIVIKRSVVLFISVFMFIVTILYVKKTYEISLAMGNTGGFMTMLQYARYAFLFTDLSVGNVLAILGFMVDALGYIFAFIIIYNYVFFGKKYTKIIYFIPIIIFIVIATMATGRTVFIRLFATVLTIFVLLWYRKQNISSLRTSYIIKVFMVAIGFIGLFYVAFQLLGTLTGKTGNLTTIDMLSIYSGSSIPALNIFLKDYVPYEHFWGSESFHSLYLTLNKLGFNFPSDTIHLSFVDFSNGYNTNIYTSLRTYVFDFGYLGMILVQIILGIFFSSYYAKIKNGNINYLLIIIYGYLNYSLAIQAIEDDFFRSFMSVTQIFELLFIVFFYNILVKKKI